MSIDLKPIGPSRGAETELAMLEVMISEETAKGVSDRLPDAVEWFVAGSNTDAAPAREVRAAVYGFDSGAYWVCRRIVAAAVLNQSIADVVMQVVAEYAVKRPIGEQGS